ncbi:Kinesin light chain-like protein [Alloalcanivorax dieselolei B5]|uniref:Kinesin light chain-like protein n=2 Tax=Alloalcanivorax dieselolei TaxID=285091 RepID=K0CAV4_ALCDB|nr:Kinesin light chain-like protein [Alloalcanivorax dieselolei B5]
MRESWLSDRASRPDPTDNDGLIEGNSMTLKPLSLILVFTLSAPVLAVNPQRVQSLNDQALSLHSEGNYQQAEDHYRQLLPLLEEHFGVGSIEEAKIRASIADTQLARQQYDEAEQTYRQVLALLERHHDTLLEADALNGLASALYLRRRYGQAEPLYLQANTLLKAEPSAPLEQRLLVLDNLAALYQTLGRGHQARQYQDQARRLRRNTATRP